MLDTDDNFALNGIDVAAVSDAGLIEHLVGFFGYGPDDVIHARRTLDERSVDVDAG